MAPVGVDWINNFPAPCTQNTLLYCKETAIGFLAGMIARGHSNLQLVRPKLDSFNQRFDKALV